MIDRIVFDQMFTRWYTQFVYFAYYFIGDIEACKDIVSDTFEYLWRNQAKIDEATAKTYLYQAVRTRCIDHLRKQNVHEEYVAFTEELMQRMAKEGKPEADDRILLIRQAMKKLTPYNYNILVECYINGKSYKEVAEELNVSVAAIHKNIVKALRTIRQEVGVGGNPN